MITRNLTEESYNQLEGIRSSHLKSVLTSQAHYLHATQFKQKQTDAMRLGTLIHMAVLEPERFKTSVTLAPDFGDMRSKANREKRDAWVLDQGGKLTISEEDAFIIAGICNSLTKKKSFLKLVEQHELEKEVSFQGTIHGLKTKARADAIDLKKKVLVDLKSCQKATPEAFAFYVRDYGVDIQQAFYIPTIESASGNEVFKWDEWTSYIIAVEKTAPFESQIYEIPPQELQLAFKDVSLALELIQEAKQTGVYRGYPDMVLAISRYRSQNEYLDLQLGV